MAGRVRAALLTATLVAAIAALASVPAVAATAFVDDQPLGRVEFNAPALSVAPNGWAAVAWIERLPGGDIAVEVALRPPGGSWSAPQPLETSAATKFFVDVAVSSSGAAVVAWVESLGMSGSGVSVVTRPAGGPFGAVELVADAPSTGSPAVGLDASDRVTLVYNAAGLRARDFAAGSSALAAATVPVDVTCTAFGVQLALAPSGDAVVGYDCGGAGFALRKGGRWTVSPLARSDSGGGCTIASSYSAPSVAIDAAGDAAGVLVENRTFSFFDPIGGNCSFPFPLDHEVSLVVPQSGVMTPVAGEPVFRGSGNNSSVQAGIAADGIVVAWGDTTTPGRHRPGIRTYAVDGSGGSAPQLVGSTLSTTPVGLALAVAANGRALLLWQVRSAAPTGAVVASERAPGGSFGEPVPVGDGDNNFFAFGLQASLADAGDGAVTWVRGGGTPYDVHVRGYDAAGPVLSGVAIPATATVGTPAAFAALATDVWSPTPLTVSWSFGDGASAAGATAQHAYAAPGSYTATVTATDALGNATSRSGVVQVGAVAVAVAGPAAPALSQVSLTNRAFRVGRAATAVSAARRRSGARRRARAPVGTTFRFTLDRAATVTIAFARAASGLRAGRGGAARCARPTRALRRARARRCTRLVAAGTLTRAGRAGANAVPFSGRVGRKALAPGSYGATLIATAGGRAGAPSALSFRVVR